jgi:glycosyltransferase involved in cell wall biosynthesis
MSAESGRLRIGIVCPRYGPGVVGGAETAARLLAEHLVALRGDTVEVFTTTALDATEWAPASEPGMSVEQGVVVHRFAVTGTRHPTFDAMTGALLQRAAHVDELTGEATISRAEQLDWIHAQGPVADGLVDAVSAAQLDVLVATPYLYHPVVHAVLGARCPVVFVPAAHDEPVFHLPLFDEVFSRADGFGWYTHAERALAEATRSIVITRPADVIGLGIDPPPDHADSDTPTSVPTGPYVACVGRVDLGKGTDLLAELFDSYRTRTGSTLELVFIGPVVHQPPTIDGVHVLGQVDDATKWALMRNAVALISPSGYESFSLVVLEAWEAGIPVLVNGRCDATREHCQRSGGGLWFDGPIEFEVALQYLESSPSARSQLAKRGEQYVLDTFTWPAVIERAGALLHRVVGSQR